MLRRRSLQLILGSYGCLCCPNFKLQLLVQLYKLIVLLFIALNLTSKVFLKSCQNVTLFSILDLLLALICFFLQHHRFLCALVSFFVNLFCFVIQIILLLMQLSVFILPNGHLMMDFLYFFIQLVSPIFDLLYLSIFVFNLFLQLTCFRLNSIDIVLAVATGLLETMKILDKQVLRAFAFFQFLLDCAQLVAFILYVLFLRLTLLGKNFGNTLLIIELLASTFNLSMGLLILFLIITLLLCLQTLYLHLNLLLFPFLDLDSLLSLLSFSHYCMFEGFKLMLYLKFLFSASNFSYSSCYSASISC